MIELIKSTIFGDVNNDLIKQLHEENFDEKKALKLLNNKNIDIHAVDEHGKTLLFDLVKKRKMQAIKFLVKQGVNIDAEDHYGKTVLGEAINLNNGLMIRFLIDQGANINFVNRSNRTITQDLALEGNLKAFRILMIRRPSLKHKDSYLRNVLFDAIEGDNLEIIKDIVHEFSQDELNSVDVDGKSALFYAVAKGNIDAAKWLITYGVDVNIVDNSGQNVLFNTATLGSCNIEILKLLIKKGINLDQEDNLGNNVLNVLIKFAKSMKNPLGEENSPITKEKCNYLKFAVVLFEQGMSINRPNKNGKTILQNLIKNKDYKAIEFLIIAGANIHFVNEYGQTVIFDLILDGLSSLEMIKFLVNKGLDLNHKDNAERTVVDDLVEIVLVQEGLKSPRNNRFYQLKKEDNHFELLRELLTLKPKINELKENGERLVFRLIKYKSNKLLRLFLNNDIELDVKNSENKTPLFTLVEDGLLLDNKIQREQFFENLSMILNYKIDINAKDNSGQTILHKAVIAEDLEIVEKLIFSKKINIDIKDNEGRTALYYTYENKDVKIARLLITNGANINETDNSGYTLLNYATILANSKLVQLLIYYGVLMYNPNKKTRIATRFFLENENNLDKLLRDDVLEGRMKKAVQDVVENLKKEINQYK